MPALVAGSCALLMTGDFSYLDLCRSQLDLIWSLRKEEDGVTKVPARHGDQGWFDYREPDPRFYIHLYYLGWVYRSTISEAVGEPYHLHLMIL